MFNHYLITAWRNFLRYKAISLINIFGLSLGLACFVAAIGVYTYISNADRSLPNADRIVVILQKWTVPAANLNVPMHTQVSPALALAMRQEFPELPVAFVSRTLNVPVVAEGKEKALNLVVVDPDYLKIVDLPRTQSVSGNPLLLPNSAAIMEEEAQALFGTTSVLGRTLRLRNALDVTITAVLKPIPEPSHMTGPYAVPGVQGVLISKATQQALTLAVTGKIPEEPSLSTWWEAVRFGSATYALLPEDGGMTAAMLESKLQGIDARTGALPERSKNEFRVVSMGTAWLQSMNINLFQDDTKVSIGGMLLTLALAVLVVACANYANLAFAQARMRGKEVGLRRTVGASRSQVAMQAVVDASLHVFAAIGISLLLVVGFGRILETQTGFPLLSSVLGSTGFWIQIATLIIAATIVIALYPALTLSRMQPAQAVRSDPSVRGRTVGADLLLGAQFVSASVMIVVLLVAYNQERQLRSLALRPGSDVLVTLGYNYAGNGVDADVWSNELLKHPAIKSVALISNPPWVNSYSGLYGLLPMGSSSIVNTTVTNVSYGFEAALDLTVRAGRTFSEEFGDAERSAAAPEPVVIDVTLARQLGYRQPTEAIGKIIKRGGFAGGEVAIIGVVADQPMRLQPALDWVGTLYAPNKSNTGIPAVRIDKSQVAEGVAWIDATWRKLAPGIPIEKGFTDDAFAKAYKIYALIASVLSTVAIITLSIALLGAFGFVMFVSNRRSHEIAIRKTLGASAKQIFAMILRDFSRPIVVANILGWPLAYIAAQRYLSTFEQRVDVTPWYFIAGLAFTLVIAWLAISHQTWRAARLKPAEVLRHE